MEITDDQVAELVMDWTKKSKDIWRSSGGSTYIGPFRPLSNGSDDLRVLEQVKLWLDSEDRFSTNGKYNLFYRFLSESLRDRDPYYKDTANQFELYYMDQYQVGDFARAAYRAVTESTTAEQQNESSGNG